MAACDSRMGTFRRRSRKRRLWAPLRDSQDGERRICDVSRAPHLRCVLARVRLRRVRACRWEAVWLGRGATPPDETPPAGRTLLALPKVVLRHP